MTWTSHVNSQWCGFRDCVEEYISFLPFRHVAGQMADIYCPLTCWASVYFGDKNIFLINYQVELVIKNVVFKSMLF